ncbi:hypothetical protein DRT60_00205 [Salmonella enterica subsp. enterica serovar Altona]|nr:hypothetical protein [Salmonella enterica subsp. enterica serovar Altona]EBV0272504.1 hypothetical protein [Salmonella enterica subsp. enterica serovar Altona]EBW7396445.1 hypothetical protein [Salmonella enterica subsp. enterica serovar Altona]EBX3217425.1 hypothetical protein [Salmonella enterica subsp. enterica serovar Altona]EDS7055019.1 hypothetical protein [Salmonella enterica subsp. enterica]
MYEKLYPLDTAAEIMGCQQKKIMAEWAKGTIQVVLDFGPEDGIKPESYTDYDRWGYPALPWNSADISAPATVEFFPDDLLNGEWLGSPEKGHEIFPTLYHEYSQSGFYFDERYSEREERESSKLCVKNVLLYGYWAVPYEEFSRLQVQDSFTLKVCSRKTALTAVTAIFTPRGGSRRINAPEKKNLRITESDMAVMRKLLSGRPGHQQAQPPAEEPQEHAKTHGGVERFALEREKILAAALYIAHHFPKEKGKSFKSHAECISKHAYLFWKGGPEGDTPPDPERIAKILSDATRTPDEWKILGGNAKSKR